jgi:cytochrome c oxidase subunit 4
MASHTNVERTHDPSHHIVPVPVYGATLFALIVLMALTIWVSYLDLGVMNIPIALAIAVTKAVLVVLFFMGVKYGTNLTRLWASVGFIWFLLMFGTLGDYVSRNWIHLPQGW